MKTYVETCPVDWGSDKKKQMYLSTWFLENSTYGGAGDPTHGRKDFGERVHTMTVDVLCRVISDFYEAQTSRENWKLTGMY
jgi:creatinine amidohydrolase/Fe(II)-dependent formamide hydrolase-like protein